MRCRNATAEVRLRTFLSPCVDDCGPYGQCKLLRTHNYLYAACECKAGEQAGLAREPSWGAGEGGGNLCSRVWRGWCGVRVPFPGSDAGPDQRGQQECLLSSGLPLTPSALCPCRCRVAGLGLHGQRGRAHLRVPAAVHTSSLPEQPHVFATRGPGHSEPICAGSSCLHLHHVLLHGMRCP